MAEFAQHTAKIIDALAATAILSDADIIIEQQITSDGQLVDQFHITLTNGVAMVTDGPAPNADLTIRQDLETAQALRAGEIHAQRAFLTGRLEIDGDIDKLLEHGPLLQDLLRAGHA